LQVILPATATMRSPLFVKACAFFAAGIH